MTAAPSCHNCAHKRKTYAQRCCYPAKFGCSSRRENRIRSRPNCPLHAPMKEEKVC